MTCCLQDVPDLPGFLQPVRAHYVFLSGGLSSVYEPQESAAISNWQRPGKTKAWTILVEYLIEYHSSALIELDRRRQQSERPTQMLFLFHSRTIRSRLHPTSHEAERRRMFTIKIIVVACLKLSISEHFQHLHFLKLSKNEAKVPL